MFNREKWSLVYEMTRITEKEVAQLLRCQG